MTITPFIQPGDITSAVLGIVFLMLIYWSRRRRSVDAKLER